MANTKSAQKNARKNEVRRIRNNARRSSLKTAIRKVYTSLEAANNPAQAQELLQDVAAKLGRARGKGILHKNTAARKLSRLARQVARLQQPSPAA